MRKISGLLVAVLAACGGSQDTSSQQQTVTEEGPPVEETPVTETPTEAPKPVEDTPAPPPKKLTIEERIAFHAGCFADFLKEAPDFFDRCYTDSSSEEMIDSGDPVARGKAAITASTKPFWDAFTLEGESTLTLGSGNNVVTLAVVGGTNDAPFMGAPKATGKKFSLLTAEVQNLDDQGRHGDVRMYVNMAAMMGQMGMAPKGTKFRAAVKLTGAPGPTVVASGSEDETKNVEFVKSGFELFNKKDVKGLTALYTADAVLSDQMAPADYKGSKGIEKAFKEITKAFPDAKEQVDTVWGAGDYVVAETTFSGTNKAAAPGMGITKATKQPVALRTAHVFKIEGGKVKQHWIFGNGMSMAMQLGLIKPPAPPAADKPAGDKAPAKAPAGDKPKTP